MRTEIDLLYVKKLKHKTNDYQQNLTKHIAESGSCQIQYFFFTIYRIRIRILKKVRIRQNTNICNSALLTQRFAWWGGGGGGSGVVSVRGKSAEMSRNNSNIFYTFKCYLYMYSTCRFFYSCNILMELRHGRMGCVRFRVEHYYLKYINTGICCEDIFQILTH